MPRVETIEVRLAARKPRRPDHFDGILFAVGGRDPTARPSGRTRPGVMVRTTRLHRRRQADAHQRPSTSSPSEKVGAKPMLAPATHEGKWPRGGGRTGSAFDARCIPSVGLSGTDSPRWPGVGTTEQEGQVGPAARYGQGHVPPGRQRPTPSIGRDEGLTKLLSDEAQRVGS